VKSDRSKVESQKAEGAEEENRRSEGQRIKNKGCIGLTRNNFWGTDCEMDTDTAREFLRNSEKRLGGQIK
jgi:hypothetical protein